MKLPAVMLYPGDWEGDEVAFCSLAAQGLWLRMMFIMHRSTRYGYLSLPNGSAIPPRVVAAKCGTTEQEYLTLLAELDSVGKVGRTNDGTIFSRRMVRDEQRRAADRNRKERERGRKRDVTPHVTPRVTQHVTPLSGGSSVSTSISEKEQAITPEMVTRSVLAELGLSGRELAVVLDEVCRSQMKLYETPGALRDALIAAWRDYDTSRSQMTQYTKGPAKFFGDGDWRNKSGWPWKEGQKPAGRKYVNG